MWDLSKLPKYVRKIPSFQNDFRVFVRQTDPGISYVSKAINFIEIDGVNLAMVLTLTAAAPTNFIDIEAWFLHSAGR